MAKPGGTTARGYGHEHQQLRERWRPKVEAGLVGCPRCHKPILQDQPWQLGHTDDRTGYNGPEHRYCNEAAGGRNGAAVTNGQRSALRHSRAW